MNQRVLEFAKHHGYETALRLKNWKGYKVYEPIVDQKKITFVGLPLIILEKGNEIRLSTPKEAFEYMDNH